MPDTNVTGHVWPEDRGTGTAASNHDWDSAGYIGGMAAKDNSSDYVESGLGFTVDYVTPAFDLSAGLAFIKYTGSVAIQLPSDDADTYSGTWDQGMAFAVDVDAETGIALTDAAVNRVWLALDLSTNDGAYVRVDTAATPNVPTDPHIQLGEIDTSADTATELNRAPDGTFESVNTDRMDMDPVIVGLNASAGGGDRVSIGEAANASGVSAIAIGKGAESTDQRCVTIGTQASNKGADPGGGGGPEATVIGYSAEGNGQCVVIGENAVSKDAKNIVIGNETEVANAGSTKNVLVGGGIGSTDKAVTRGSFNVAIGFDTDMGETAAVDVSNNVMVGNSVRSDFSNNVGVGDNVSLTAGARNVVLGHLADSTGKNAVVIGQASSGSNDSVVVGRSSDAVGGSVAIGPGVSVANNLVARIGNGDGAGSPSQLAFPAVRDQLPNTALNTGEMVVELDETNLGFRLRGKDSTGITREALVAW